MRILIIEDEINLAKNIADILKKERYEVEMVHNAEDAMDRFYENHYDLLLLDIMLPKMDGITFIDTLRRANETIPVLMLSARDSIEDRVRGLDMGADDYLPKPFSNIELLARVRSLLRRSSSIKSSAIALKHITLDIKTREVFKEGELLKLTAKEFSILELFMHNQDTTLTRLQLAEHIWGESCMDRNSNVVDAHLKNLRKKIGDNLIETLRGVGYIMRSV
jgi:DNA-binding response OmpR family regulator